MCVGRDVWCYLREGYLGPIRRDVRGRALNRMKFNQLVTLLSRTSIRQRERVEHKRSRARRGSEASVHGSLNASSVASFKVFNFNPPSLQVCIIKQKITQMV